MSDEIFSESRHYNEPGLVAPYATKRLSVSRMSEEICKRHSMQDNCWPHPGHRRSLSTLQMSQLFNLSGSSTGACLQMLWEPGTDQFPQILHTIPLECSSWISKPFGELSLCTLPSYRHAGRLDASKSCAAGSAQAKPRADQVVGRRQEYCVA